MSLTPARAQEGRRRDRLYEEFVAQIAMQPFGVPVGSESGRRTATLRPGNLFAHPATAAFDVEWLVIASEQKARDRALVVVADPLAIRGPGDLLIPGGEPCGALTVRCAIGLRVPAMAFAQAPLTGQLPAWYLRRAKALYRRSASSVRRGENIEDPDYREHVERIEEARRSLASWCQAFGDDELAGDEAAPAELAATADDRIGQLYDEIAQLTELEADPSSPSLRKAWAELRRLQREEARRDREAFEASLAMPIDAGKRILERARASRERFEDLAVRHYASG